MKEIKELAGELRSDNPAQAYLLGKEIDLLIKKKKTSLASVVESLEESTNEEAKRYIDKLKKLESSSSSKAKKKRSKKSKRETSSDLDPSYSILWVNPKKLKFDKEIQFFFNQGSEKIAMISKSMEESGFDKRFPIFVFEQDGEYIIYDGNGRAQAAIDAKLNEVPVIVHQFASRQECMQEVIRLQALRRNLNNKERIKIIHFFAEPAAQKAKNNQGTRSDLSTSEPMDQEVAGNKELALRTGLSVKSITRLNKIMQYPDLEKRVCNGDLSIRKAHDLAVDCEKELVGAEENTGENNTNSDQPDVSENPSPAEADSSAEADPKETTDTAPETDHGEPPIDLDMTVSEFFEQFPQTAVKREPDSLTLNLKKSPDNLRHIIDTFAPYASPKR